MNEVDILRDNTKTLKEIGDILKCSTATVSRKRKAYGIKLPKGSKKGKPKPWQNKKEIRSCKQCNSIFEIIPSIPKIYCSRICSAIASKSNDKSYMQTEKYKEKMRKPHTNEYRRYRNRVTKLSEKIYQENIDIINPYRYNRTICGIENGYQLDHVISVKECFQIGMTPEEASKLENLQILPWKTNLLKG